MDVGIASKKIIVLNLYKVNQMGYKRKFSKFLMKTFDRIEAKKL